MKFEINDAEMAVIRKWRESLPVGNGPFSPSGGGIRFTFEPTGLGTYVTVEILGHKLDLWEAMGYVE